MFSSVVKGRASKVLLTLALLLAGVGLQSPPLSASVSNNAVGTAEFDGRAILPTFPCQPPPPFGNGPCSGTFEGDWAGNLSGMWNGQEFDIVWRTLGGTGINATFNYFETTCAVPDAGTLLGFASGTGSAGATSQRQQILGVMYNNNPNGFPRVITDISMTFTFEWTRVVNGALITLNPVSFTATVAGLGSVALINTPQNGTADFVPTSTSTPPGTIPNCTKPLTDVQGEITGNVAFVHNP